MNRIIQNFFLRPMQVMFVSCTTYHVAHVLQTLLNKTRANVSTAFQSLQKMSSHTIEDYMSKVVSDQALSEGRQGVLVKPYLPTYRCFLSLSQKCSASNTINLCLSRGNNILSCANPRFIAKLRIGKLLTKRSRSAARPLIKKFFLNKNQ